MKSWRIVTLSIVLVGIIAPVLAEFTTWVPPSVRDGLIAIAPPVAAALALVLYFNWRTRSYPGALFFSAGGYHHHLGTNTWSPGPPARADEAKLLEWELLVPERRHTHDVAERLRAGGYAVEDVPDGMRTSDPWGTDVSVRSEESQ